MDETLPRVLLVDDDVRLRELLQRYLQSQGFEVRGVGDAAQMRQSLDRGHFDLIVLDLMLPGENGLEICRRLRGQGDATPIVMLTAKGDEIDRIVGLEIGADDYVPKPFKPKELIARVRARLRRGDDAEMPRLRIADLEIDVAGHEVTRDGQQIALTPLEFDLLVALARRPQQVFSREVLLEQVWGYRHAADTRLVNVHVQRLRSKVEKDPDHPEVVVTVRGVGYRAGATKA